MDIVERLRACLRFDAPTLIESELEAAARDAIGEIARLRTEVAHWQSETQAWVKTCNRATESRGELHAENERLRDENAKLRADAERYRMVRSHRPGLLLDMLSDASLPNEAWSRELDAAVDTAMRGGK